MTPQPRPTVTNITHGAGFLCFDASVAQTKGSTMNRARLITNLESLMQFSLAQRVRRGDTISLIRVAILPGSHQMKCWEACLIDAGFGALV